MSFSEILNILLGGGVVALIVAVATMRATVRKANADAEKAKAEAETVHITNTENATRILVENIVKTAKRRTSCYQRRSSGHKKGDGLYQERNGPAAQSCRSCFRLSSF